MSEQAVAADPDGAAPAAQSASTAVGDGPAASPSGPPPSGVRPLHFLADRGPLLRTVLGRLLFVAVAVATLVVGYRLAANLALSPRTTDAEIDADIVRVSAPVAGRLVELAVVENQSVAAGQLLFRVDPETYRLQLELAQAELAVVEGSLADQRRLRESERANAAVAQDEVSRAQTNLDLATRSLERLQPMEAAGYVSRQTLDEARTAVSDAAVSLRQALGASKAARNEVQTTLALEAQVRANLTLVAIARRALEQTEVQAPVAGKVVGLKIAEGENLVPGVPLFTLIDSASWVANGLFPETALAGIQVGDSADVFVMIDQRVRIAGTVDGIGWGVVSDDEIAAFGGLPYVARTLNWVQVAARFPVRIRLHVPPEPLMRIGASAVVILHEQQRTR